MIIMIFCFFCSKIMAKEELFLNVGVNGFYVSASITKKIEAKKTKLWSNVFLVPDIFKYAKTGTGKLEKIAVLSNLKNKKLRNVYYINRLENFLKRFSKIKHCNSETKILKSNFYVLNLALKSIL